MKQTCYSTLTFKNVGQDRWHYLLMRGDVREDRKEDEGSNLLLSHLVAFDRVDPVLGDDHEARLDGVLGIGLLHPSDPLRRFS